MGGILGKVMDENTKKTQVFMLETQQLQMERQLAMQNMMRERQMAMMIAKSRDFFWYFITFDTLATLGLTAGFLKRKNPALLAPLIPLSVVAVYQWDLAYGPKMKRMRGMATDVLETEQNWLELPHGMPTFAAIDAARLKLKEKISSS